VLPSGRAGDLPSDLAQRDEPVPQLARCVLVGRDALGISERETEILPKRPQVTVSPGARA